MDTEGTPVPASTDELRRLREGLRDRHSIDHLARAWTSSLVVVLLVGICLKLNLGSADHTLLLRSVALLGLAVFAFAAVQAWLGFRLLGEERARLRRLRDLEGRAPRPPELF